MVFRFKLFNLLSNVLSMDKTAASDYIIPDSLNKKYNGTMTKRKEEIIARDVLSTVNVCTAPNSILCKEAREYLSSTHSRIEICAYGAQMCIPPCNNNELYLISSAYHYAGASYRKEAIYWYERYIENGAISDYIPSYMLRSHNYCYDQRVKFIANAHGVLADLYTEENLITKANDEYMIAISIAPFLPSHYIKLAHNFIKQQDFSNAESILDNAKKSTWYQLDNTFKECIDNHIVKYTEKIKYYQHFLNTVIPSILKIVENNSGILQKDLYDFFPGIDSLHIRWACKYLSKERRIIRNKKGNSYALYIANRSLTEQCT